MSVQIGARPDSGFDDPIGMLKDCHRRVERFLRILCQVVERAHGRSLDAEESAAVQAALHYFRTGGLRHTADEEESLFPRLRAETAAASGSGSASGASFNGFATGAVWVKQSHATCSAAAPRRPDIIC